MSQVCERTFSFPTFTVTNREFAEDWVVQGAGTAFLTASPLLVTISAELQTLSWVWLRAGFSIDLSLAICILQLTNSPVQQIHSSRIPHRDGWFVDTFLKRILIYSVTFKECTYWTNNNSDMIFNFVTELIKVLLFDTS